MLQQVNAQNDMNYDLISVGTSMTFYLSCHFPSGLMSLCYTVDAFQPPQGPIMNSQKSSCNSLGSRKIVGLWLDVCVIRCPFFKPKDMKTFSLPLLYMFPFLFFHISLLSHILSFLQIIPANHSGTRTKSLLKDGKLWSPCTFSTNWTKFNFAKIQTNTGNFCGSFLSILFASHLRESVVDPAIFLLV